MSEVQKPSCPVCSREMRLKQVFRQQPFDHYVFKCMPCGLEYPVVKKAGPAIGEKFTEPKDAASPEQP